MITAVVCARSSGITVQPDFRLGGISSPDGTAGDPDRLLPVSAENTVCLPEEADFMQIGLRTCSQEPDRAPISGPSRGTCESRNERSGVQGSLRRRF